MSNKSQTTDQLTHTELTLTPAGHSLHPPARRPRRTDAQANEELILAAAQQLFAAHGVESVTMSAIAAAAGLGKGTLYRAFANKGELCLALMDDDLRRFQEETLQLLAARRTMPTLDLLADFLDRLVFFMAHHAGLMCEADAHGALNGRAEVNQTSLHDWFHTTVTLLLRQAMHETALPPETDIAYLADAILALFNPKLLRHQLQVDQRDPAAISQHLRRFVMTGISGQSRG
ncbi:MAG: TetR/AcrR family transcriptional regulator [Caldilineaceae bacterium]|nr:TetR/AcrR family transcriptional regulator [Caldilineaceae bacterium]